MDERKVRKIQKLIDHWKDDTIDYEEAISYRHKALDLIAKYGYDPCDFEFTRGYNLVPIDDVKHEIIPIKTSLPHGKTKVKKKRNVKKHLKTTAKIGAKVGYELVKLPLDIVGGMANILFTPEKPTQYEVVRPQPPKQDDIRINIYGNNNNVYVIKK